MNIDNNVKETCVECKQEFTDATEIDSITGLCKGCLKKAILQSILESYPDNE